MYNRVDWIAEVGSNHKGIKALAIRMIEEFAAAGATTIKFQLGHSPEDPVRYIDPIAHDLAGHCAHVGVEFLASCWSTRGLDLARKIRMRRRKIAHMQVSLASAFVMNILDEGPITIVSIDPNNTEHRKFFDIVGYRSNIRWLAVTPSYPMYPQDFSLPVDFFTYHGLSSHVPGIAAPLAAVAHRASIIECHVTLDPTEESIKDNHFALTPDQFATMVRIGEEIARLGYWDE